jgi:hypothetical protein
MPRQVPAQRSKLIGEQVILLKRMTSRRQV